MVYRGVAGLATRIGASVFPLARRGALLAVGVLLLATAGALGFAKGASYTGKTCQGSAGLPGATCVFRFRASSDGRSLRFVGATVVSGWRCGAGGGEALLGGKLQGATPIPQLRVRSNGTIYGSAGSGARKVTVTGHVGRKGKGTVITFHQGKCETPPVTLKRA